MIAYHEGEMELPQEEEEIIRKIKKLGDNQSIFTRNDLRDAHFGRHLIGDWQYCLDKLTEDGYLICEYRVAKLCRLCGAEIAEIEE